LTLCSLDPVTDYIQARQVKSKVTNKKVSKNTKNGVFRPRTFFFEQKASQLGSGAYGTVVRGRWQETNVAVKLFKKMPFTPRTVENFWKEVSIMWKFRHPNIVDIKGACCEPNQTFIVMELLGQSLTHFLHAIPSPPWSARLNVLMKIARGLMYLHSKNTIHRDLKSQNVLLSLDGKEVKLCDFGLAAVKQEVDTIIQRSRVVVGSTHWMAPELFKGVRHSFASDVYAFGVVCAEIISCQYPFPGVDASFVPELLKNQEVSLVDTVLPEQILPDCPDGLLDTVLKPCMQRDPAKRPSMQEVFEALRLISFPSYSVEEPPPLPRPGDR